MKKLLVIGTCVVIIGSCNSSTEKTKIAEENLIVSKHHEEEESETIELNDGEKWVVNEEMKPFVFKGEELVNTFLQSSNSDYASLAEQLEEQNSQLIKSCTMKGKSHDELHKWLHPHLEIVKALKNETNATKSNEIVLKLQQSYQQFHQYFN